MKFFNNPGAAVDGKEPMTFFDGVNTSIRRNK